MERSFQKSRRSADTKQEILRAALRLMAQHGYSGTTISMICRESGVTPSSLYWHFDSKEALMAAVVEDGARRGLDFLPRWSELPGTPLERLERRWQTVARQLSTDPEFLRLLLLLPLERRDLDPEILTTIRRVRVRVKENFAIILRDLFEGADREELDAAIPSMTEFMLALNDGAFIAHQIDSETDLGQLFRLLRAALQSMAPTLLPSLLANS